MTLKRKLAATAIALTLATGSVVLTAAPAMAATVYTKSFYNLVTCSNFYYNPPKNVHPDFWWGCRLTSPGVWTVKYTVSKGYAGF